MVEKKYCLSCETTHASASAMFSMVGNEVETKTGVVKPGYCSTCLITGNIFNYLNQDLQDPIYTSNVIELLKSKQIPDTAVRLHMSMKLSQYEESKRQKQQQGVNWLTPVVTA